METLDFSISFGQNSLESISDRVFEYAFSRHPLLLPFSKSTFICSPVMGIYFLLALYRQFCSVLGFEGEQDMVLVHKEHLWMWGCGRRQKCRWRPLAMNLLQRGLLCHFLGSETPSAIFSAHGICSWPRQVSQDLRKGDRSPRF